jgi:site-specific DNA recombinase
MGTKGIGYVRASTRDQEITIQNQQQKIQSYAKAKDIDLIDMVIEQQSGKDLNRVGVTRILQAVQKHEVDAIIIYKVDRMFRNTEDALAMSRMFRDNNVAFHSISESIDTASPWGKFFYTMISAFAELERNVIRERTKAALQHQKTQRKKYCRNAPYGLMVQGDMLVDNPQEKSIIARITLYRERQHTYSEIANALNYRGLYTRCGKEWHPQQVKNVIINHKD